MSMKYLIKKYRILSLFILILGFYSCVKESPYGVVVDRTVLIYMASNNNLRPNAIDNLAELKRGYLPNYFEPGGSGEVLLVYYDNPDHLLGGPKRPPRLLRISRTEHGNVQEEIIQEYSSDQNSADVATLKEVLEYADKLFPSEERGLFLWSHGTGWVPRGFYSNPIMSSIGSDGQIRQFRLPQVVDPAAHLVKSFGSDTRTKPVSEMDIKELAAALPIKYSFIVFDACLMAGIEVAYELKDKTDYIIASTAEVLVDGFPYDKIMTHIYKSGKSDLVSVCEEYMNFYRSQPSQGSRSATISLVETSKLGELAAATAVIFNKDREVVDILNMNNLQRYFRYKKNWFYDLDNYIEDISSDPSDYTRFSSAMANAVKYSGATQHFFWSGSNYYGGGFPITRHSGLSTYVPKPINSHLESYYRTLSWNKDTKMIK